MHDTESAVAVGQTYTEVLYYFNHWLVLDSSKIPEITKWNDLPDEIDSALL